MSTRKLTARIGLLAAAVTVATGGLSMTADASTAAAPLRYGSHGWGVKCVQEAVNNWAARTGHSRPLGVDGSFGSGTRTWVERFQSASGVSADGVVGRQTGNSVLANLQGDSTWRHDCYYYVPSTHG
ncbi:peptidoglycan-binding domain-containing protein [Streptomyces sp. NPDC046197]|uniref:peptidoglycan-binding domain-containing protein n=1 Tax=Streptomyces sp. NPDC046197 TaxID=3154337 RepID=UPI0033FADF04